MPRTTSSMNPQQADSDADAHGSRHHDALPLLARRAYAEFFYDNPRIFPQEMTPEARLALTTKANRPLAATMDLLYSFTSRRDRGVPMNKKWLEKMLEQIRLERGDTMARLQTVLDPTGPIPAAGVRRRRGRVAHRHCAGLPAAPIQEAPAQEDAPAPAVVAAPAPVPVAAPAPAPAPAPVPTPAPASSFGPFDLAAFLARTYAPLPAPAVSTTPFLPSPFDTMSFFPMDAPLMPEAVAKTPLESVQVSSPLVAPAAPLDGEDLLEDAYPAFAVVGPAPLPLTEELSYLCAPTVPGLFYPTTADFYCGVNGMQLENDGFDEIPF